MEKKYLVFYNNQGMEISRRDVPKFLVPAWENIWAIRSFASRKKVDSSVDHWDIIKTKQE